MQIEMKGLNQIKEIVENTFGVPDISNDSRERNTADARRVYCFLARKYTNHPIIQIGDFINKHHATIIHHARTCLEIAQSDKDFRIKLTQCEELLILSEPEYNHKKAIEMIEYWTVEKEKIEKENPELFGKLEENN